MKFDRYIDISRSLMPSNKWEVKSHHFTFILKKGRVRSIGLNSLKTHPSVYKYKYRGQDGVDIRSFVGLHSELNAVIKYGEDDCSDCTFINIRIDKNGNLNMSKPCVGCQHLLDQVGYKRIFYTTEKGDFEEYLPHK